MKNSTLPYPVKSGIWVKFYHFGPKNDGEKWSRKNIFEIPPCAKPFSNPLIYFKEWRIFFTKLQIQ